MIKISSPQDQLRSNRNLLALVGGSSTVIGFLVWSSSPFLFPDAKDRVEISLRYLSLVCTVGCGVTAIVTGSSLQRITPLIKAVEQAEKADFISQLATSQWVQEQGYQQQAITALQPSQQPAVTIPVTPQVTDNRNSVTPAVSTVPEVTDKIVTQPVTDVMASEHDTVTDDVMEGYKPLYLSVMALKQQGITDSEIIKDTLKMEGRNYNKGKEMLETLLSLGQSQGW